MQSHCQKNFDLKMVLESKMKSVIKETRTLQLALSQIKFGITPEVNALASVLLAGSLTLLALAFGLPQLVRATRKALKARTA